MSITVNENGVMYELSEIYANENGVTYELDTVHSNEGGVLHEIHSKWAAPINITWSGEDTSTVSMLVPSGNGYNCEIITHTLTSNYTRLSVTASMSVKGKTAVSFTYEEAYWSTQKAQYWTNIVANNTSTSETISATIPAAPSECEKTYSIDLPTGNYDVTLNFTVYDTGTQSRNITIVATKAA